MPTYRERNFDEDEKTGTLTITNSNPDRGEPSVNPGVQTYASFLDVNDWVTPNYKEIMALGGILNNPATIIGKIIKSNVGVQISTEPPGPDQSIQTTSGDGPLISFMLDSGKPNRMPVNNSIDYPSINVTDLITQAKARAIANIDPSGGNYAEDVGEMGQTIRFLKSPFKNLRDVAFDFKRDRKKRFKRTYSRNRKGFSASSRMANATADTWLQYRFAVRPLIRSIAELYVVMLIPKPTQFLRRTSRGFDADAGSTEDMNRPNSDGQRFFSFETDSDINVRAYILYEDSDFIQDWRQTYGFRNKDLAKTAWDLIPFSFMLDRVLNVGTAISAFANISDETIKIRAAGVVTKYEHITDVIFHTWNHPTNVVTLSNNKRVITERGYTRDVWEPNALDVVPPVKLGNIAKDATYVADLAAIIYNTML